MMTVQLFLSLLAWQNDKIESFPPLYRGGKEEKRGEKSNHGTTSDEESSVEKISQQEQILQSFRRDEMSVVSTIHKDIVDLIVPLI